MPKDTLTGSRIRERRVTRGMKQAELAREAGISASYLNLIEHNRRRIGGKLLLDIAQILGVEPSALTEGAGAALVATLREAASDLPQSGAELDRIDEFAGRLPGWAQLLADSRLRIAQLERSVETLTDRMAHDPQLATSLHEMLSTVTAIRSAASILAEPGEVDREWQVRFHRNIYEDSARLAETSRGLVTYLEADDAQATETGAPQEELDSAMEAAGHHVPELEGGADVGRALARLAGRVSRSARSLIRDWLEGYAEDATALPLAVMRDALDRVGEPDPLALAHATSAPIDRVMRRLAAMPVEVLAQPVGLAICDASGVLSYRKPLPDFTMPRFGAGCPLWPLYRALNRPMVLLGGVLRPAGRGAADFRAEALAMPVGAPRANVDPLYKAQMLVRPLPSRGEETEAPDEVGVTCRVCPRPSCVARREPSIFG